MDDHFAPVMASALILTSLVGWLAGSLWLGVLFVVGLGTWGIGRFEMENPALPFFVGTAVTGILFLMTGAVAANGNWGLFFSLVAGIVLFLVSAKK